MSTVYKILKTTKHGFKTIFLARKCCYKRTISNPLGIPAKILLPCENPLSHQPLGMWMVLCFRMLIVYGDRLP